MAQLGIQQLLNAEQEAQQIVQQARDGSSSSSSIIALSLSLVF